MPERPRPVVVEFDDGGTLESIFPNRDLSRVDNLRGELTAAVDARMRVLISAEWHRRGYQVIWAPDRSCVEDLAGQARTAGHDVVLPELQTGPWPETPVDVLQLQVWASAYADLDTDRIWARLVGVAA